MKKNYREKKNIFLAKCSDSPLYNIIEKEDIAVITKNITLKDKKDYSSCLLKELNDKIMLFGQFALESITKSPDRKDKRNLLLSIEKHAAELKEDLNILFNKHGLNTYYYLMRQMETPPSVIPRELNSQEDLQKYIAEIATFTAICYMNKQETLPTLERLKELISHEDAQKYILEKTAPDATAAIHYLKDKKVISTVMKPLTVKKLKELISHVSQEDFKYYIDEIYARENRTVDELKKILNILQELDLSAAINEAIKKLEHHRGKTGTKKSGAIVNLISCLITIYEEITGKKAERSFRSPLFESSSSCHNYSYKISYSYTDEFFNFVKNVFIVINEKVPAKENPYKINLSDKSSALRKQIKKYLKGIGSKKQKEDKAFDQTKKGIDKKAKSNPNIIESWLRLKT